MEGHLRTLLNSVGDLVFVLDKELRYREIYGRLVEDLGVDSAWMLGRTAGELFGGAGNVHTESALRTLSGIPTLYEWEIEVGGTARHMETSLSPLADSTGLPTGVVGVCRDVTPPVRARGASTGNRSGQGDPPGTFIEARGVDRARVSVEDSLRAALHRYREIADALPEGVFEIDVSASVVFVNSALVRMSGYSSEASVLGLDALDLLVPEDRARARASIGHIVSSGSPSRHEYQVLRKDGTRFPALIHSTCIVRDGVRCGVRGVVVDISERKASEDDMHRTRMFLDSVVENIPSMIVVKDARDFRFVYVNRATEELTGLTREERLGHTEYDLYPKEVADEFRRHDLRAIAGGASPVVCPTEACLTKHRGTRLLQTRKIAITDSDGEAQYVMGISDDITERVRHEQELGFLQAELRERNRELEATLSDLKLMQGSLVQSEKMASIGQLTAGIAHEINNPLAYVASNLNRFQEYFDEVAGLLLRWRELGARPDLPAHLLDDVAALRAAEESADLAFLTSDFSSLMRYTREGAGRIKDIVERLRGFSHLSGTGYSATDLNRAVEDTVTIVWNELKYKATLKKELGELSPVVCNPGEIKQVLVNLLVNAAQAIPERGEIVIRTYQEEGAAFITVSDTGCGIPKENLSRIFDPFFTTKPTGKGTGLGLWISSTIIHRHHGTLTAVSTPGHGSTFTAKIPLEQEEDPPEAGGNDSHKE